MKRASRIADAARRAGDALAEERERELLDDIGVRQHEPAESVKHLLRMGYAGLRKFYEDMLAEPLVFGKMVTGPGVPSGTFTIPVRTIPTEPTFGPIFVSYPTTANGTNAPLLSGGFNITLGNAVP